MRRLLAILLLLIPSVVTGQTMTAAKSEANNLLNAVLPFAKQMLSKHGEFYPYGAALSPTSQVVSVAAASGGEHPPSIEAIKLLVSGFKQGTKEGKYKATALVYDSRVQLPGSNVKSDAIAVSLNHKDGYSVVVYLPYTKRGPDISFGQIFATVGENNVFPKP